MSVPNDFENDHPTPLRPHKSWITHRYIHPSAVATYVISETQTRFLYRKLSSQKIFRNRVPVPRLRRYSIRFPRSCRKSRYTHDSRHPIMSGEHPPPAQFPCHLRTPIPHFYFFLNLPDPAFQFPIFLTPPALRPPFPCVLSTACHSEHLGHPLHAVDTPLLPHKPVSLFFGFEKMAIAFRKISLSPVTIANSRFSRAISRSRGFPFPGNACIPRFSSSSLCFHR